MQLRSFPILRWFPCSGSPNAATFDWWTKFPNFLREQQAWSSVTKLPTDRSAIAGKISDWYPMIRYRIRSVDDWKWLLVFRGGCRDQFCHPGVNFRNISESTNVFLSFYLLTVWVWNFFNNFFMCQNANTNYKNRKNPTVKTIQSNH